MVLTFLRNSGLPFFTVATNISPTPAAGNRFNRPRIPCTAMTYKFLAPNYYQISFNLNMKFKKVSIFNSFNLPVLSAQLITAPTGKPKDIRNFPPADPPRPLKK